MNKLNLLLIATALAPLPAHATLSWNFAAASTGNYGSQGTFNGVSGAPSVTVSAFSTTGTNGTDGNPTFAAGKLASWYGSGLAVYDDVNDSGSPHHAFDNDGGPGSIPDSPPAGFVDAAVFSFTQNMSLESLSIGWYDYDADLSVLAYTEHNGSMSNPNDITGKTFSDLLSNGWEYISDYMNVYSMPNDTATITTTASSSYWLVSAYTSCASGNCNATDPYFGNDYFKISGLSGTAGGNTNGGGGSGNNSSVPEPSILLLLSIGLLGWRMNRNKDLADSLAA